MDWPTALVSVAGSAAAATVAVWALVSQAKNAERDRQHDLLVRRQERRSAAYLELLTALRRLETGIVRTAPFIGPVPDPPPSLSDEETWHLSALADVAASKEVGDLMESWLWRVKEFHYLARDFERQYERGQLDQIRRELFAELNAIRERVRSEL